MIASIPRKTGDVPRTFRGTVYYVLQAEHTPALVGGSVVVERNGNERVAILHEFEGVRSVRPDVRDPVVHMSLSFAPGDRRLSHAELAGIAEKFVTRLGYTNCQYVVVEHNDRSHQHVHVILNRVRPDGTLVPRPYNDWFKAMQVCRQLEIEYGLTRVERSRETGLRAPSRAEIEHGAKQGRLSERMLLQQIILPIAQGRPSLPQFIDKLQEQGISARFHLGPDGKPVGISYHGGTYPFAGSALGPSYTFRGIQHEGVRVDADRDIGLIRELAIIRPAGARAAPKPAISFEAAVKVRAVIVAALADRPSLHTFVERLAGAGVQVQMKVASTGYVSGIRFRYEGVAVRGSQLGREFSLEGLRRQGLDVSPERDAALIRSLTISPEPTTVERLLTSDDVRFVLRGALADRPDLGTFIERLREAGIRPRFYTNASGHPIAISYRTEKGTLSARDLGEAYRWPNIRVTYSHDQHAALVAAHAAKPSKKPQAERRNERLIGILTAAVQGAPSLTAFIERIEAKGVGARLLLDKDATIAAIHYHSERGWTDGRDLDGPFTWRGLVSQGVRYEPALDNAIVARLGEPLPTPRTLSPDQHEELTRIIAEASADRPKIAEFLARLDAAHVGMSLYSGKGGEVHAIAYHFEGVRTGGRDLGEAYRWQNLEVFRVDAEDDVAMARVLEKLRGESGPRKAEIEHVQAAVIEAALGRPNLTTFVERLRGEGVGVRLLINDREHIQTIVYRTDDRWVSARALGEEFTWGQLRRFGVHYDPAMDADTVARVGEPAAAPKAVSADQVAHVQAAITDALVGRPDLTTFVDRLAAGGVKVRFVVEGDQVASVRFEYQWVTAGSRQLGRLYSWPQLIASGLHHSGHRDTETIRARAEAALPIRRATPEEIRYVRTVVASALLERPSLTAFVDRLAERAIEVRLYLDPAGQPFAIGYGFGGTWISATEMGESYRWRQVLAAGVHVDPESDRETLVRVAVHLEPRDTTTLDLLHAADRALYVASLIRLQIHRAEMLVHDPVGLALEMGADMAINLVRQGVAQAIETATERFATELREAELCETAVTLDHTADAPREMEIAAGRRQEDSPEAQPEPQHDQRSATDREPERARDGQSDRLESSAPGQANAPEPERHGDRAPQDSKASGTYVQAPERVESVERREAPSHVDVVPNEHAPAGAPREEAKETERAVTVASERREEAPIQGHDTAPAEARPIIGETQDARIEEHTHERDRDEREPRGEPTREEPRSLERRDETRTETPAPGDASGSPAKGIDDRGRDTFDRGDHHAGDHRADADRADGGPRPDARHPERDRGGSVPDDERAMERPVAGRDQSTIGETRGPLPDRGDDVDVRPVRGNTGRGDEEVQQAVGGDRARGEEERVPARADERDVSEGARTASASRDATAERGGDAERREARASERSDGDQPLHRPEAEVRSGPAPAHEPDVRAGRADVVERHSDPRHAVADRREPVDEAAKGSARQAAAPAHDATPVQTDRDAARERLLDAMASLRKQNELQESRMPLRSTAAEIGSRAEEISRLGQTAASVVRNVPNPAQIGDLAEHPEKAPLAAAKEVAGRLGPIAAPVSKAVDGVSKHIDRSSGADHDR